MGRALAWDGWRTRGWWRVAAVCLASVCSFWVAVVSVAASGSGGAAGIERLAFPPGLPATYYGPVGSGHGITPTAGMTLSAWIDGVPCGQTTTQVESGEIVYRIDVFADDGSEHIGCGASGRVIAFQLGTAPLTPTTAWNNSQVHALPLAPRLVCLDENGNGWVDIADLEGVAGRWQLRASSPNPDNNPATANYEVLFDLTGDGLIGLADLIEAGERWQQPC